MAHLLIDSPYTATQGPWYLTTAIICPSCARQYLLTQEDFASLLAANIGASGTRTLGWEQVVEGDPTTAVIDVQNLNIDPAQIVGQCPYCQFWPVVQRGPHYGTAKTTLSTDPAPSDVQAALIAQGYSRVSFFDRADTGLYGVYLTPGGLPNTDASGLYASAVWRNPDGTINGAATVCLAAPGQRVEVDDARALDAELCAWLERYGLVLI
jgi:hypothetical protein